MRTLSKKGQVNSLAPAMLALVFAAVVLVFGLVISQELRDTREGVIDATVANESLGNFTSGSNITLDKADECGFTGITSASVVVYNATGNVIITAGIKDNGWLSKIS